MSAVSGLTAALVAGGLLAGGVAAPVAAGAVTPALGPGDIAVTTFGHFTDGAGLDVVDHATHALRRVATFGVLGEPSAVASLPNGDTFVGFFSGDLVRVDHVTGDQTFLSSSPGASYDALTPAADGTLVGLLAEPSGVHLVRIGSSGTPTSVVGTDLSTFGFPSAVAVAADRRIYVTAGHRLLRVDPATGAPSTFRTFDGDAAGLTIDAAGRPVVRVHATSGHEQLVRVDPVTAATSVLTTDGFLLDTTEAIAMDVSEQVVVSDTDFSAGRTHLVRIDPRTGGQKLVLQVGTAEAVAITVIGRFQVGGGAVAAQGEQFSFHQRDRAFRGTVAGNDSDPLGHLLRYEIASQPSHGVTFLDPSGGFDYFPAPGFAGTDPWGYRVVTEDGRSAAVFATMVVLPDTAPDARPDAFTTTVGRFIHVTTPGMLANDTDPQGSPLRAAQVDGPAVGDLVFGSDGSFEYHPPATFVGDAVFHYVAVDPEGNRSAPTSVTVHVRTPATPTVVLATTGGLVAGADGRSGTFPLVIGDADTASSALAVTASSSAPAVVAPSGLALGATVGGVRPLTVTATGQAGSAVVTVTVSDGSASATLRITVVVGSDADQTLTGTSGPDLLIGLGGRDALHGGGGRDVLSGGNGADVLTGGKGADAFRGGAGADQVTDFDLTGGDTQVDI